MTWTVTKEEAEGTEKAYKFTQVNQGYGKNEEVPIPPKLHVRAIIDIDNEQAELKDLIASLQKHVKEGT